MSAIRKKNFLLKLASIFFLHINITQKTELIIKLYKEKTRWEASCLPPSLYPGRLFFFSPLCGSDFVVPEGGPSSPAEVPGDVVDVEPRRPPRLQRPEDQHDGVGHPGKRAEVAHATTVRVLLGRGGGAEKANNYLLRYLWSAMVSDNFVVLES